MLRPFPGMDPYLERFWLSVHNTLITYLRDDLNARLLPADLRAEMTERVLISSPDECYRRRILPDIYVDDEPVVETTLRITDLTGATLVTAVELLSASNKLPGRDREQYLRKRDEYHAGGANTVEIDLFRGGERTVPGIDVYLPAARRSPYLVITRRARRRGEWVVYPLPLRARLPAFRIPLRAADDEVLIDLQPLLDRAYANGRYPIDYARDPDPPLEGADAAWASALLRAAGRRP